VTCQHIGRAVICRPGPTEDRYTGREYSAVWCDHCRRRRVHREVIEFEIEPSYYDPSVYVECPCGRRRQ
jgi:hypothetical protein